MGEPARRSGIRDVAEQTGLSVSTVSRALNGYSDVKLETRRKVETVAEQLGYRASFAASSLRSKQTNTVTFMVSKPWTKFVDPFFLSLLDGVELSLQAQGYALQIIMAREYETEFEIIRNAVERGRCDGLLFGRTRPDDERVEWLQARGFPFVTVGRTNKSDHDWVDVDHYKIGFRATERLIRLGHARVAHLTTPLRYTYSNHALRGYRDALEVHGIGHDPALEIECYLSRKTGADAVTELITRGVGPTAIFCGNDVIALSAMEAMRQFGVRPGPDMALIGCDDIPVAAHVGTGLTTFRQDLDALGMRLGRMMVAKLNGDAGPHQQLIDAELILRGTDLPQSGGRAG
ncbi:MAG: LacI family transcriptional regulator [Boseongicola sp. SB0662_bin_57]|nr:LacI family transcriptional regulator [Boseongicola sp. SB0662_bin_57]